MNYASQIRVIRAQIDKSDTQHVRGDHIQPLNNHLFVDTVDFTIVFSGYLPTDGGQNSMFFCHFSTSAAPQYEKRARPKDCHCHSSELPLKVKVAHSLLWQLMATASSSWNWLIDVFLDPKEWHQRTEITHL